jgi:tetratricopeptide (TPR) repeat protein
MLPGLAQNRPGSHTKYAISGNVRDDFDQHAMERVRVELKGETGTPINSAFTRDNGEFEFDGLPSGDYAIEISVQGYESFRETISIDNSARTGVFIFLRRLSAVPTRIYGGIISAHELSVPRKAHDEYEKGLELLYSKADYKGAILQFQRAIKDFPKFYEAYLQEGNAYVDLEEMGPAEEALRKSVDVSSNRFPDAYFRLAWFLNNAKRYSEAEPLCRQGLTLDASSWLGNFEMARALIALSRIEEAEKHATQARDLKPDNPAVYLLLANIYLHGKDYAALLKDLDDYLKVAPAGPEAEQVRKTRDEVQMTLKAREQARSKVQDQPGAHTQDQSQPASNETSQSEEQEPVFPPLPPPEP